MKIATFNVNSIRSRLGIVLDWMKESQTDVLCVQETKAQDKDFPEDAIRSAGYEVIFHGEKSYNGVAIISRHPIEKPLAGFDDDGPADKTRLISGEVNGVRVINVYIPQGRELDHEMYAYKLAWFERLKAWMDAHFSSDDPVLLCGDVNVARFAIDVANAKKKVNTVCFHEDVRAALERLIDWGFTDVFRTFHPEDVQYSFFDYRVKNALERNVGWRIDYVLATNVLAEKCTNSYIDFEPRKKEKPSDHTPLVAEFGN